MKKRITKKGYRVLAIVWTLAAASMAVAFVRRLPQFNLLLFLLLALSVLTAGNFWQAHRRTPEDAPPDLFSTPPRFAENPVLFDDIPETHTQPFQKDSEENTHE